MARDLQQDFRDKDGLKRVNEQVIEFLKGSESCQVTDKDMQDCVPALLWSMTRKVCLFDVSVKFDAEGELSLELSDEDAEAYKALFKGRWTEAGNAVNGDLTGHQEKWREENRKHVFSPLQRKDRLFYDSCWPRHVPEIQ